MEIYETDDEPQEANVYLYKRPVEENTSLESLSSTLPKGDLAKCILHWLFAVIFNNGKKSIYLKPNQKNELLVPSVTYKPPKNIGTKELLGTTKVSPAYVVKKAITNSFNLTKCTLLDESCQNWFAEIYQNLALDIDKCPIPVKYRIDSLDMIIKKSLKAGLTAANMSKGFGFGMLGTIVSSGVASSGTLLSEVASKDPSLKELPSNESEKKHSE